MTGGSLFTYDGDAYAPTKHAGSPWGAGLLHGGPVAALLAYSVEGAIGELGWHVARLTVDLMRPVPARPLVASSTVVRRGRKLLVADASLTDEGTEVARAHAVVVRTAAGADIDADLPPRSTTTPVPGPHGLADSALFPPPADGSSRPYGYHNVVRARWVGSRDDHGGTGVWLQPGITIIAGQPNTPLMVVASLVDFLNAVSPPSAAPGPWINCDLTINQHRPMTGTWLGIDAQRATFQLGTGGVWAALHDERGQMGTASEAILRP